MPPTRAAIASLLGLYRLAAHALWQACGAGSVEHRRAADRRFQRRRVAVAPVVPVRRAPGDLRQRICDVERRGDFRRRLDHQQTQIAGKSARDLRQQVGVADQNFGAAVGQDIGDLLGLQMPVDRHHRAAQRGGGAGDLEQREIIAQHHGDRRAALQPERPQSRRGSRDAGVNLGIADAALAADDHGRFLFSPLPTRPCAWRGGVGGGGAIRRVGLFASTEFAEASPTPDPSPPLRGGEKKRVRSVKLKQSYLSSSISPKPTQLLPLKRRSRNCWNGK